MHEILLSAAAAATTAVIKLQKSVEKTKVGVNVPGPIR